MQAIFDLPPDVRSQVHSVAQQQLEKGATDEYRDAAILRKDVVAYLKANRSEFEPYVSKSWDKYVLSMGTKGQYGDHVTLEIIAKLFRTAIHVVVAGQNDMHIAPNGCTALANICLIYYPRQEHYDLGKRASTAIQCALPENANLPHSGTSVRSAKGRKADKKLPVAEAFICSAVALTTYCIVNQVQKSDNSENATQKPSNGVIDVDVIDVDAIDGEWSV